MIWRMFDCLQKHPFLLQKLLILQSQNIANKITETFLSCNQEKKSQKRPFPSFCKELLILEAIIKVIKQLQKHPFLLQKLIILQSEKNHKNVPSLPPVGTPYPGNNHNITKQSQNIPSSSRNFLLYLANNNNEHFLTTLSDVH